MRMDSLWRTAALAIFLFAGSFIVSYWGAGGRIPAPLNPGRMTPQAQDEVARIALGDQAKMMMRSSIDSSGAVESVWQHVPKELVGLTLKQVEALHPEWVVLEFGRDRLVVMAKQNASCTDDERKTRHLGVSGDVVGVYEGVPGRCGKLVKKTRVRVDRLPEFQQVDLRRGIPFEDDRELFLILEGLNETP